ncbi:hypothetical protein quinque_008885 [Culex quinquefasciatus]
MDVAAFEVLVRKLVVGLGRDVVVLLVLLPVEHGGPLKPLIFGSKKGILRLNYDYRDLAYAYERILRLITCDERYTPGRIQVHPRRMAMQRGVGHQFQGTHFHRRESLRLDDGSVMFHDREWYRGRVREKLKNPPATVNHLGLLLNLLEEGRRRTGRSGDTVADFKNLSKNPESDFENVLLPRKAELVGRGEEEDGPHIWDLGRVQGMLESPSETDDHLGLLLNLQEEARRKTIQKPGPWPSSRTYPESDFKNISLPPSKAEPVGRGEEKDGPHIGDFRRRKAGVSAGDGRPLRSAAEPAGRGEEEDGPNFRDVGRVQEKLESPSATDDHLGLLLNLREEAR